MTRITTFAALAGVTAASLMVPVPPTRRRPRRLRGVARKAQKQFLALPYEADAIDFFPHTVTINIGDSVKFVPTAFHNIDIPARGKQPIALLLTGPPVAGAVDPAGAPYWFNGLPTVKFNPKMVPPNTHVDSARPSRPPGKGTKATYTGAKEVLSPIRSTPDQALDRQPHHGRHRHVLLPAAHRDDGEGPRAAEVALDPGLEARRERAEDEYRPRLQGRQDAASAPPTPGVVNVGYAGDHGVEYFGFLPETTTVPVGTTLTFKMTPGSLENHTATHRPRQPDRGAGHLPGQDRRVVLRAQFDPAGVYASEPSAPTALTPTLHGNGFWNSGVLDSLPSAPAARVAHGHVRRAGHVSVLVHGAPADARDGHRAVIRALVVTAALAGAAWLALEQQSARSADSSRAWRSPPRGAERGAAARGAPAGAQGEPLEPGREPALDAGTVELRARLQGRRRALPRRGARRARERRAPGSCSGSRRRTTTRTWPHRARPRARARAAGPARALRLLEAQQRPLHDVVARRRAGDRARGDEPRVEHEPRERHAVWVSSSSTNAWW